jgi:glycosyltransferase involved in cell wall biosynthesis
MRILAITNLYPRPDRPLLAPFNRQQFRALAEHHELRIIAPVPWTDKVRAVARLTSVPRRYVNRDGIWVDHPTFFFPPRLLEHTYGQFYLASVGRAVRDVLREFRPQVLLGCWAHPDGWAAVRIARQAGLPVLIKVIGSDVLVAARNPRRRRRIAEALLEADGVMAVSHDLAEHVTRLGVSPRKIDVVSEGVDGDLFRPGDQGEARRQLGLADGGSVLLFVGNLLLSKGAGVLVEACGRLRQRGRAFHCYLVGQGRDAAALRSLIGRHGLDEWVTLAGACPQERLPDWYRASDLVALPSFSEGVPNVLREALACGRPFVATAVGGIPEISRPPAGRLVPPGDADALADALAESLDRPPVVDEAARRGSISWQESARLLAERLQAIRKPRTTMVAPPSTNRDSLRILAITNQYPRLGHDMIAPFNRQQFRALAEHHQLHVVTPVSWTDKVRDLVRLELPPRRYLNRDGIWVHHPAYFFPPRMMQHHYGRFYLASVRRTVERVLRRFRPQVLLGCWAHPDGWATVRLAREFGLPVLIKVHGSDVLVTTRNWRRRRRIAEALSAADGVVAVSRDLADHVVRLGVDPARVHVVYNGVDADLFRPGEQGEARRRLGLAVGGPVLLFVGNLLFSKGAGVLVEACGRLRQRGRAFHCYLVGQGRDAPALRSLIGRHGLGGCVTLAGACPQERLPDWYRASDLVALPSFSEGVPNVLREALACGRPFVATAVGGIPEISRPPAGRLVPPGDADALADALAESLDRPPLVDEAARRGSISWQESARLLAERLQDLVAAPKSVSHCAPPAGGLLTHCEEIVCR